MAPLSESINLVGYMLDLPELWYERERGKGMPCGLYTCTLTQETVKRCCSQYEAMGRFVCIQASWNIKPTVLAIFGLWCTQKGCLRAGYEAGSTLSIYEGRRIPSHCLLYHAFDTST